MFVAAAGALALAAGFDAGSGATFFGLPLFGAVEAVVVAVAVLVVPLFASSFATVVRVLARVTRLGGEAGAIGSGARRAMLSRLLAIQ